MDGSRPLTAVPGGAPRGAERASDADAEATKDAIATGARIGRYVILEHVGSGAMGAVYAAYDPELDRKIALKLLKAGPGALDAGAQARLLREAKAMGRLAHPNVIAVHDAGMFEGQVFLAMEFVAGGTLRSWLSAQPRGWRAILDLFVAAGRGLAAAHAAGLVHRDFKPDNVLVDREGRPRVVDFGLAREAGAHEPAQGAGDSGPRTLEHGPDGAVTLSGAATLRLSASGNDSKPLETLTRTGAVMGTPAYMAPEQFLSEATDERTDQFSYCVALYEALYKERPFRGDNLLTLGASVTEGQLRPLPKAHEVPTWVRRALLRGLRTKPADRYPSMSALIAALEDDPAVKIRRRLLIGGAAAAVVAGLVIAQQAIQRRHRELERQIAGHVQAGTAAAEQAATQARRLRELRGQAFAAFDGGDREQGEALWRQALGLAPEAQALYEKTEKAFESALVLDGARQAVRARLGDLRFEHLQLAEELRMSREATALQERLAADDADGSRQRALAAPGTLVVRPTPPDAKIALERYEHDAATGRRAPGPARPLTAGAATDLAPGSYRIILQAPGRVEVLYPFEIERGQKRDLDLSLPPAAAVPAGFVYIPPGPFWFGDADEQLRTQFLDTVPLHRRETGAYLIARHETTFREWLTFLETLPAAESLRLSPHVAGLTRGSLTLTREGGVWELSFKPAQHVYSARAGQPIVYLGRKVRSQQDWRDFPVTGISADDTRGYLAWLAGSGRVPGARLCTELEWERAARGADDRVYPQGDELHPEDANFDLGYGRVGTAYGPDAVGSHPRSRSPFGVDDLVGNAFEIVTSVRKADEIAIRGGAYYFAAATCRSTNREVVQNTWRDVTAGLRVCAPTDGGKHATERPN